MKSSFSIAKKKTPFQRQKQAEEEKRKKEEEEAAKVYAEFVESFQGSDAPSGGTRRSRSEGSKGFVSGGTVMPGQSPHDHASAPAAGGPRASRLTGFGDRPKPPISAFDDDEPEEVPVVQPKKADKDKPRAIDLMLEKLKQEQQEREVREAARKEGKAGLTYHAAPSFEELGMNLGSLDSGDPTTTNLYIGNMAPDVDEAVLVKEFGRFGAIGSVKVMWPRDEEQRRKGRNCGFVAFMRRDDAAKAMEAMDGVILHDFELRIGWGKSVNLPAVPCWPGPGAGVSLAPTGGSVHRPGFAGGAGAGMLGAAVPPPASLAGAIALANSLPWGSGADRMDMPRGPHDGVGADIEVPIIEDLRQRFIIDSLALYVQQDGCAFEQLVMEEEQGNPEYAFLFDLNSPEHIYYRWRVYSLAEGDTLRTWRIEPFVMVEGGQRWVAPSMTAMAMTGGTAAGKGATGASNERYHSHERSLSDKERDRFEDILRNLTVERSDIRNAMIFALDCADAGADVVETLAEALSLPETPIPQKIARLFLVSDILHNSTAPVRNASRYRGRFEAVLPGIFESLQETYRSVETRITQEALRRHVLRVLRCWREKYVFSDDFLNGLQATFLQPLADPAALAANNPTLHSQLQAMTPEETERKCRLSGLSSKGTKDDQIAKLLALDAYINNTGPDKAAAAVPSAPVDAAQAMLHPPVAAAGMFAAVNAADGSLGGMDVDGVAGQHHTDAKPAAPVSRWTTIDEDEDKQARPAIPVSKWLQQEAEQERQRQAAAAAAAAEEAKIFSDTESGDEEDKDGERATANGHHQGQQPQSQDIATGGAAATPNAAEEEKRRAKLRQVELACARLEAELEDQGLTKAEVEARVSAKRAELMSGGDDSASKAAALDKWRSRRESSSTALQGSNASTRDRDDKDKNTIGSSKAPASVSGGQGGPGPGGSSRDGSSRSERKRSRSRERDKKESERKRSRSRERKDDRSRSEKDSTARRRSRSRSRDRKSDKKDDRKDEKKDDRKRSNSTPGPDSKDKDRARSSSKRSRSRSRERRKSRSRSRDRDKKSRK